MDRFLALGIAVLCLTVLMAVVSGDTVGVPALRSMMV
jgi:hypothetical protein